jgi:ABC-type lipoprotein release transport system permease subunit
MPDLAAVRHWELVMPEVLQGIEVDRIGGMFMYWLIMILVVFSVINSFIMTVFERTREFGMLRAIGMRPAKIILMVQFEALFGCLIGVAIGLALASAVIAWLIEVGIPLGEAMEDYATQFYMPARLYPAFSAEALLTAPVVMVIGTQIAAILPALRIRQLKPVEALRED